jgi:glycosyltransferase involved in cell wall biosynthesis
MKIVMLLYNDFSADTRVHKEARDLAAAGHEVTVVATRPFPELAPEERRSGYAIRRVPLGSGWRTQLRGSFRRLTTEKPRSIAARAVHGLRQNRLRQLWIKERLRRRYGTGARRLATALAPDVVHAHDLDTLDIGADAAARLGVPLVYDSHELWRANNFILKLPAFEQRRWQRREARHIGDADAVIITTESRAAKLREWYPGVDPVVVMNCQDGEPLAPTNVLRERLALDASRRIVLYQGLVHADRGIFVALDALERLPERFVTVVIGPGPDAGPLARAIAARGLEGRAFVLPPVPHDELPELTASANYGLSLVQNTSLSYYLSAPNKLFEYMRAGLPMVASDFPEVRRVFEAGDLGERVDPADASAVATALIRLDEDPTRCAAIRAEARALVRTRFNWETQRKRLLEIYERLATPERT